MWFLPCNPLTRKVRRFNLVPSRGVVLGLKRIQRRSNSAGRGQGQGRGRGWGRVAARQNCSRLPVPPCCLLACWHGPFCLFCCLPCCPPPLDVPALLPLFCPPWLPCCLLPVLLLPLVWHAPLFLVYSPSLVAPVACCVWLPAACPAALLPSALLRSCLAGKACLQAACR